MTKEHRRSRLVMLAALLMLSFAGLSSAQTATPTPKIEEDNAVIRVDSRLIVIPASVTNAKGEAVSGLTEKDFRVLEEGRPQTIESIGTAEKVPLEIALLFDISASTDKMFQFELETAAKFLRDVMRAEDRATVFTIGKRPVLIGGRDNADAAAAKIRAITPTKDFTAFYDTVGEAARYLSNVSPEGTRRVILVISDGEDTNSAAIAKAINDGYKKINVSKLDNKTLYQLTVKSRNEAASRERSKILKLLQDGDTVFYSINPAGSSYTLNQMSVFGQETMASFATSTGGTAFLPKFRPLDTKDALANQSNQRQNTETLSRIFAQLANELRAQYVIRYNAESDYPTGKFIKLNLSVPARPDVRIRARQGYYVTK
ncbi:MAG: VWA domain-containing protein [Blastocatellia bacterium]|nr:VWA domain-containing protein [Blastocatellia bacterium]